MRYPPGCTRPAILVATAVALLLVAASPTASAASWRNCDAMIYDAGRVEILPTIAVINGAFDRGGFPKDTTALFIQIRRGRCATAWALLRETLASADESTALGERGFRIAFARDFALPRDQAAYRLTGVRGRTWVRYVRFGRRPRIDHSIYRAGQWVDLYGVARISECTGGFVLRLRSSPFPVALTAGHCASNQNLGQPSPVRRGFDGSPPATIGSVLDWTPEDPDAAIFSLSFEWGVAQQIERGERPPLSVTGWVATNRQEPGDRVCMSGRGSGADVCGQIVRNYPFAGDGQRCADIRARPGDSGGPVYSEPGGLRTRAVGIASRVGRFTNKGMLCYEPIGRLLDRFNASLAGGPLVRGPGLPG